MSFFLISPQEPQRRKYPMSFSLVGYFRFNRLQAVRREDPRRVVWRRHIHRMCAVLRQALPGGKMSCLKTPCRSGCSEDVFSKDLENHKNRRSIPSGKLRFYYVCQKVLSRSLHVPIIYYHPELWRGGEYHNSLRIGGCIIAVQKGRASRHPRQRLYSAGKYASSSVSRRKHLTLSGN